MRFPSVNQAIECAKEMGLGYEVMYPKHRWLTKKSYAANFTWKGHPKPVADYD